MERRLLAWAAWLTGGRSSAGYPVKNVLHPSWMPPAGGRTPTMVATLATTMAPERQVHAAVMSMSQRLQDTLAAVYVLRASADEQVSILGCQASTVRARVAAAKAMLAQMLRTAG